MNHLQSLSNQSLHEKLFALAADERRVTLEVLHHLREAESRRMFATRGHSSLFEYATRDLGYSESSALRRISAMRILKGLPELEGKVESGELKVSQLSQVHSFIRQEKKSGNNYDQDQKRELLLEVAGKSARETEKVLAEKNPEFTHREKVRTLTAELTQITFTADEVLLENLKRIRDLFAHELPVNATHADLVRWMSTKMLKSHEKKTATKPGKKAQPKETQPQAQSQSAPPTSEVNEANSPSSRYIPAETKREVWSRDQGRCVYVSSETGRVCGSTHRLQIDHRVPYAYGGPTTAENLRILCHARNQSEARRIFRTRSRPNEV
jgi:5-methylcytosine-specific restriction endonuclease McrA